MNFPVIASRKPSVWSAASWSAPEVLSETFGASLQTLLGGNITLYTEMCEHARADAHQLMIDHAAQLAANAIIGVRYDANEITAGVTEVLAYGTAVHIEISRS